MNELRQEFEAHEEIAQAISNNEVYYDKDAECYIATAEEFMYDSGYLNGAWWVYEEQHKKIVAYQKMLEMQKAFDKANSIIASAKNLADRMRENRAIVLQFEKITPNSNNDDKIKEIFMVNSNELHNNR